MDVKVGPEGREEGERGWEPSRAGTSRTHKRTKGNLVCFIWQALTWNRVSFRKRKDLRRVARC
jgi:hypothetical protein